MYKESLHIGARDLFPRKGLLLCLNLTAWCGGTSSLSRSHLFDYCPPNKRGSQGEEKGPGKFWLSTMSQVVLQNIPEIHTVSNEDINMMVPPTATLHNRQQDQRRNQISKDCAHLSPRYHLYICLKKRAKGHNPSWSLTGYTVPFHMGARQCNYARENWGFSYLPFRYIHFPLYKMGEPV